MTAAVVERMEPRDAQILAEYATAGVTMRAIAKKLNVDLDEVTEIVTELASMDRGQARDLALAWQKTAKAATWRSQRDAEATVVAALDSPRPEQPKPKVLVDPTPTGVVPTVAADNPAPVTLALAITEAEASGDPKLAKAAAKIRELLVVLRADVAEHKREAKLRAELAQIETRAAEIREQLKPRKAEAGADNKAIRAWAADNQVACPTHGRIPAAVVDAYHAAHPPQTAV